MNTNDFIKRKNGTYFPKIQIQCLPFYFETLDEIEIRHSGKCKKMNLQLQFFIISED